MRVRGSDGEWFWVEFLLYREPRKIKVVAYVRRKDGLEMLDGEYDVRDEIGERRWTWKRRKGEWEPKWRHKWQNQP